MCSAWLPLRAPYPWRIWSADITKNLSWPMMTNRYPSDQVARLLDKWPEDSDATTENSLGMIQPEPQLCSPALPKKRSTQIYNDSFFRASRYTARKGSRRFEPGTGLEDGALKSNQGCECRARSTVSETPGVL